MKENAIHETQLDKQKVNDAINNHLKRMREEYRGLMEEIGMKSIVSRISIDLECELKEELGLEESKTEIYCKYCKSILTKEIIKGKERLICPKGHHHPTEDYSYLCGSDYCRCCQ